VHLLEADEVLEFVLDLLLRLGREILQLLEHLSNVELFLARQRQLQVTRALPRPQILVVLAEEDDKLARRLELLNEEQLKVRNERRLHEDVVLERVAALQLFLDLLYQG